MPRSGAVLSPPSSFPSSPPSLPLFLPSITTSLATIPLGRFSAPGADKKNWFYQNDKASNISVILLLPSPDLPLGARESPSLLESFNIIVSSI